MLANILYIEHRKTIKRRILWIELALMAGLMLTLHIILYVTLNASGGGTGVMPAEAREQFMQTLTWPGSLLNALGFAGSNALGGLLVIVLVGAITAQEYTWRSFHLWISHGIPRPALLAAKFTSFLLPSALIVLTSLVASGAVTAWISLQVNGGLHLDQLNALQLFYGYLRTTYSLLPYAALTFLLAVATRSTVAAIGGGLAYTLLIEGIFMQVATMFGGSLAQIGQYLPGGLSTSILDLNRAVTTLDVGLNTGSQQASLAAVPAAIGIMAWTLLFTGIALWVFRRQDLTG